MSFILASASPRRAELLTAAGFRFRVVPADVDETPLDAEDPRAYVLRVAGAKADHVAQRVGDDACVLAADTTVVGGERLMAKPISREDAESMLRTLSGAVHLVHTGVVVRRVRARFEEVVTTEVRFSSLSSREIEWYLASGEADGKAGAYGIQGRAARFIESIVGSWSNVVGLPIATAYRLLSAAGIDDLTAASGD